MGDSLGQETQGKFHKKRSIDTDTIDSRPSKRQKIIQADDELSIKTRSIDHWRKSGFWPEELLKMDNQNSYIEIFRAVKRADSRKRAASVANSFNDQNSQPSQPSNNKSEYLSPLYSTRLAEKGYFIDTDEGPSEESFTAALALLKHEINLPQRSCFDDAIFKANYKDMHHQNEARVIRDFGALVFPSPHHLFLWGETGNNNLTEMYNGIWAQAIEITNKQPMPDGSVGFRRSAFSSEQLAELRVFLGDEGMVSNFAATLNLLFPFITCEAKRSQGSLDPADNANAHSSFIAVRAIVYLYQLAGLETKELNRMILGFSVSHNDDEVRIWAYYPFIQDKGITYHRCRIKRFFLQEEPDHRWTAYRFVGGVYEVWAKAHLDRIKNVINGMIEKRKAPDGKVDVETESDDLHKEMGLSPATSRTSLSVQTSDEAIGAGKSSTTPSSKSVKQKPRKR